MLRRTLPAQVQQQTGEGADLHQKIADTRDVIISTENAHQNAEKENAGKEPFQRQYRGLISTGDPYAFVPDLFDVAKALYRFGMRLLPRNVLPAMLFRQQIKMKLQLFLYFTMSPPAV